MEVRPGDGAATGTPYPRLGVSVAARHRWYSALLGSIISTERRASMPADQQKEPAELGRGPLVDVAQALSDVARSLEAEPDLQRVVEGIVAAVTETVPGAEQAGVSLREGQILRTVAATGDLARRLNAIEHELDEGPCVQAVVEHRSYRIDDMFISVEGQHNPSGAPQSARRTRTRRGERVGTPPKGMTRECLPRVLRWG